MAADGAINGGNVVPHRGGAENEEKRMRKKENSEKRKAEGAAGSRAATSACSGRTAESPVVPVYPPSVPHHCTASLYRIPTISTVPPACVLTGSIRMHIYP
eukprot:278916-Rhodomonas_salina.2